MSGRLPHAPRGEVDLGNCWLDRLKRSPNYYIAWNDGSGTRRLRSTGTRDLQQALLIAQAFSEERRREEAGLPDLPTAMPVSCCLLAYWEEHAKHLASATGARSELRRLHAFLEGRTVAQVTEAVIDAFVAHQQAAGYAMATISRSLATLRAALKHQVKKGRLESAPFIKEVFEQHHREMQEPKGRRLEEAEMVGLFAAAAGDPVLSRYLLLLAGTLGRPEAVRELTREQVDFELGCVRLNPRGRRQTKKHRAVVPLIGLLRQRLADTPEGPLLTVDGHPVGDLKSAWRRLRARAGLDAEVNPYSFRHTFAYWLKRAGIPTEQIGQYLGHKPARIFRSTGTYVGVEFESLAPAAAKIDEILARVLAAAKA